MEIEIELINRIKEEGHISISDFMKLVLTQSKSSYYRSKNPIGEQGDFITSPEISQMFGEMIGIWVYQQWLKLGKNHINLVELGPGNGSLTRDVIKVLSKTDMQNKFSVRLFEINEELKNAQKESLRSIKQNVNWIRELDEIENKQSIFLANEFFDALPINQYIKEKNTWKEFILKLSPGANQIIFDKKQVPDQLDEQFKYEYIHAKDGAIIEESIEALQIAKFLAQHAKKFDSAALIVDYGYDIKSQDRVSNQFYSTLQAIKEHKYVPILDKLGSCDLTAHVDFNKLKLAINSSGAKSFGTITQRDFLKSLGIDLRANILMKLNPELKNILNSQLKRLTDKGQMGNLFKVLTIAKSETKFIYHS